MRPCRLRRRTYEWERLDVLWNRRGPGRPGGSYTTGRNMRIAIKSVLMSAAGVRETDGNGPCDRR